MMSMNGRVNGDVSYTDGSNAAVAAGLQEECSSFVDLLFGRRLEGLIPTVFVEGYWVCFCVCLV